jgi:hypothetical protein
MTELHQCKATMGTERATTIDFTEAQAQARAIAATINHGGMLHRTFARASQNVAATAKGHPQHSCRAACGEFGPAVGLCFHLKPSPFQGQPTKNHNSPPPPMAGTTSSPVQAPSHLRGHSSGPLKPSTRRRAHRGNEGICTEYRACSQHHGGCSQGPRRSGATCATHASLSIFGHPTTSSSMSARCDIPPLSKDD